VICGRPDGRLSALSTAEAAVCLSVNQASSIQSLGGTCESITIGHNPFKLALSERGIFLKRKRPLFLCERMLIETDVKRSWPLWCGPSRSEGASADFSVSNHDSSVRPRVNKRRSAAALIGAYMNFDEGSKVDNAADDVGDEIVSVEEVVESAIRERKWSDKARKLFQALDVDGNGFLSEDDFIKGAHSVKPGLLEEEARAIFISADNDESGHLDYDQFIALLKTSTLLQGVKLPPCNRDERGIIQIEASREKYFGEVLRKYDAGKSMKEVDFMLAKSQHFSQELYETRIASLQRFVAMTVMFHQMGKRVQDFFAKISFGFFGYRMDRTHSIMRIATTASPISGSDVRQRMRHLQLLKKVNHSINVISSAYLAYKNKKESDRVKGLEQQASQLIKEE
jgi:EF-hand domain pair